MKGPRGLPRATTSRTRACRSACSRGSRRHATGALFKRVWRSVAHEPEAPTAKDRDRTWSEVLAAAAIQGALFGGVKALIDRAGATGFARLTGVWPGKTKTKTA
jgi:Protein of unknown function (DUF4235)